MAMKWENDTSFLDVCNESFLKNKSFLKTYDIIFPYFRDTSYLFSDHEFDAFSRKLWEKLEILHSYVIQFCADKP